MIHKRPKTIQMFNLIQKYFGFFVLLCGVSLTSGFSQNKGEETGDTLKKMALHIIPQAHIDLSWWWRYDPETIHVIVKHTLETAFGNMERFPD